MSQSALAKLAGTSQPQIDRLEKGERRLTEDWMRRLAKHLDVRPMDLMAAPLLQDFAEDATPYIAIADPKLHGMLEGRNLSYMQVQTDVLENLGLHPGDVRLFDFNASSVEQVGTGDVVIAQLYDRGDLLEAKTVMRQFVAPGLLITNRSKANLAITMVTDHVEAAIKAVLVPDHLPAVP